MMQRSKRFLVLMIGMALGPLAGCSAAAPEMGSQPETDSAVAIEDLSTGTGLQADYFNNQTLSAPTALSRTDATVNFNWGTGSPGAGLGVDHFSARWTGQVEALFSQTYTFFSTSDDGIRLWVNGQQIINNWTDHAPTENSGTIALSAGQKYDLRLEFYENGGGATATLSWASASQPKQIIPKAQLYPPASSGGGTTIPTRCSSALPAGALAADVSHPTTVVGSGTAASCTFAALNTAVTRGGVVTFNCGAAPVSIPITATLNLPTGVSTVIDGGNKITFDGGNAVQILRFDHGDFMVNTARLTLQHLTLINGKATPTQHIPSAPAPCSQGWNDGEGGALYMRDGNLTVIDCTFSNNHAAPLGPDTGGGAIYVLGSKSGMIIAGSVFTNNSASNGGAVGGLFCQEAIYNSLFQSNSASGNGANSNDPSKCSAINNGQNEVGSGGNGAAIYQDGGNATNVILCGDDIVSNTAGSGAFGGGVFMTSNDFSGTISVQDSIITGNTGGSWTQVMQGTVTNLGTAFGVNAKSATVVNSTLQGR